MGVGALVMWTLLGVCCPQGLLYEPRFLSQGCIFGKYSLAKGMFLTRTPKNGHLRAKLCFFLWKISLNKGIFGLKFLKIMQEWAHEIVLSQGYVFNQNFPSQGYPIENQRRTPP